MQLRDPDLKLKLNTVYFMWLDIETADARWRPSYPPMSILFSGKINI